VGKRKKLEKDGETSKKGFLGKLGKSPPENRIRGKSEAAFPTRTRCLSNGHCREGDCPSTRGVKRREKGKEGKPRTWTIKRAFSSKMFKIRRKGGPGRKNAGGVSKTIKTWRTRETLAGQIGKTNRGAARKRTQIEVDPLQKKWLKLSPTTRRGQTLTRKKKRRGGKWKQKGSFRGRGGKPCTPVKRSTEKNRKDVGQRKQKQGLKEETLHRKRKKKLQ